MPDTTLTRAVSEGSAKTPSDASSKQQGRLFKVLSAVTGGRRSSDRQRPSRPPVHRNVSDFLTPEDTAPQSDLIGRPRWTRRFPKADSSCVQIGEEDVQKYLAENWRSSWKWLTLAVLAIVQVSMNFNASVYGNAVEGLKARFGISDARALQGQWIFLILYAFGCELWAPWSEDMGRHGVLQMSLWAVNLSQIFGGAAGNIATVILGRAIGGLCSAGGSITLGVVADMYKPDDTQKPVAFVVYFSVLGSVIGPVVGALLQHYVASWRWIFWTQLLLGAFAAAIHLLAPETRSTILVKRYAQDLRLKGRKAASKEELQGSKLSFRKCCETWWRPFQMFLMEPVVLCLSLLSGFSDALIFMFLEAYGEIYGRVWHFGVIAKGLAFLPLAVGYTIGWFLHVKDINRQKRKAAKLPQDGVSMKLEEKLRLLLWTAPLEFFGLLIFALASNTDWKIHWTVPMIASVLVGIANYSIYMATIDYMVSAYGPYAASATGGNGFARDLLAGISALYAMPLYRNVGTHPLVFGSVILAGICVVVLSPIYIFFAYGDWFRSRSHFMKKVQAEREQYEANVQARGAAAGGDFTVAEEPKDVVGPVPGRVGGHAEDDVLESKGKADDVVVMEQQAASPSSEST